MSPWIAVAISLVMLWCIVGWAVYRSRCDDTSAEGSDPTAEGRPAGR